LAKKPVFELILRHLNERMKFNMAQLSTSYLYNHQMQIDIQQCIPEYTADGSTAENWLEVGA
jgi:hypothetical protein